jgi:hypothetical protein
MKKLVNLLFIILFPACNNSSTQDWQETLKSKFFNEDIEWSNTWIVSVNKNDLPKVLIIGDSHVERYYPVIAAGLQDIAYCSKFTTSRSLGDPALIEQLRSVFFSFKFDIISFNNGLHGVEYTDEQYSQYIPVVYNLFRESNHGLKLIWVNTTARRIHDNIAEFEKYNVEVINRNRAVKKFTQANNIPLIDFYTLSVNHPEFYETDGIHFNKTGVEEEAQYISDEILKIIENMNFKRK